MLRVILGLKKLFHPVHIRIKWPSKKYSFPCETLKGTKKEEDEMRERGRGEYDFLYSFNNIFDFCHVSFLLYENSEICSPGI